MIRSDDYALDSCIKCTICVANCPVAKVTNKFAGPKQNGPDLERFRLEQGTAIHPSVGYCTNCKNCDIVCPSGVKVSAMITRAKVELTSQQGASWRDRMLGHAGLIGKASQVSPRLINWACHNKLLRYAGEKLLKINRLIPFQSYAGTSFYGWYAEHQRRAAQRKVLYYPGCYALYNAPEVGEALVKVLEENGTEVIVDEFECCGLPLIANGLLAEATKYATRNLAKLRHYIGQGYEIITSCPSCNLMLRSEYQELEVQGAAEVGEHIFDVFEYLQLLEAGGEMNTSLQAVQDKMAYHQPCHLKAQQCGIPSLTVLSRIPGLTVDNLDAGCCGQAGSYGFKQEKYAISMAIGQEVCTAVRESGVEQVLTECGMCQLRLAHGTGVQVVHPIEVLARAYR